MAIADMPGAVDHIGLGHTVHPEIDRGSSIPIDSNATIGVADTGEEIAGIHRLVFVGYAVEDNAGLAGKRHQRRLFFAARRAPRREEIDQGYPATQILPRQSLRRIDQPWQIEI